MRGDTIRVVLADDHALVRSGLRALLASATDIEAVGEATNGLDAVALVGLLLPDIVVMDITMGDAVRAVANGDTHIHSAKQRIQDKAVFRHRAEYVRAALKLGLLGAQ